MYAHFFPRDEYFMRLALREAGAGARARRRAGRRGDRSGRRGDRSRPQRTRTARRPDRACRDASRCARRRAALDGWRVLDAVLYVTLEPCAMCAGAVVLARIPRVVFAAADPKAGAAGSVLDVLDVPQFNHRPTVQGGLLARGCRRPAARVLRLAPLSAGPARASSPRVEPPSRFRHSPERWQSG